MRLISLFFVLVFFICSSNAYCGWKKRVSSGGSTASSPSASEPVKNPNYNESAPAAKTRYYQRGVLVMSKPDKDCDPKYDDFEVVAPNGDLWLKANDKQYYNTRTQEYVDKSKLDFLQKK